MLLVNNFYMDLSTVYGIMHFKFTCFGELTVIVSLSDEIGIPFKISHVNLENLRHVNGKGTN